MAVVGVCPSVVADRKLEDQRRLMKSHAHSSRLVDGISVLRSSADHVGNDVGIASVLRPDVEVVIGSGSFACHRFVLGLSSGYFRRRLRETDEETNTDGTLDGKACRPAAVVLQLDDPLAPFAPLTFDKILDFVYTGSVELSGSDVVDVYLASVQLDLNDLSAVCVDYMIATLSAENCVIYWTFAESGISQPLVPVARVYVDRTSSPPSHDEGLGDHSSSVVSLDRDGSSGPVDRADAGACHKGPELRSELGRLAEACCLLVQAEFDRVTFRPDFGELNQFMVESVLNGRKLRVKSEVDVCEMILRWLDAQTCRQRDESGTQQQQQHAPLWRLVRWTGVHIDYIRTILLGNEAVRNHGDSMEFLQRVITFLESGTQFYGLRTFHRVSTGLERCLMAFGVGDGLQSGCAQGIYRIHIQQIDDGNRVEAAGSGSSSALASSSLSDRGVTVSERGPSTSLSSWPTLQRESAACCTPPGTGATVVYVSGLGRQCCELWTWSVAAGWTRCGDMVIGRSRHGACYVGGRAYAIGGVHRGATVDSIEYYDPVLNIGRMAVGKLVNSVKNFACLSHRSVIYVFGGVDAKERAMADVQMYDTVRDVCTTLVGRSMPRPLGNCRAVLYGHYSLVFSRSTCLVYDLLAEKWTERRRCGTGVRQFGLAVDNGRIYVFGGVISEPGAFGTIRSTLVDQVKSLPVSAALIGDQVPVWKHHVRLPKSAIVSAFAVVTLPSSQTSAK